MEIGILYVEILLKVTYSAYERKYYDSLLRFYAVGSEHRCPLPFLGQLIFVCLALEGNGEESDGH